MTASPFLCFCARPHACAVRVDAVAHILPLVALRPLPGAPAVVEGVFLLRGEPVPVFSLAVALGQPPRAELGDFLVVCRAARRDVALHVDEVLGVRELDAAAIRDARGLGAGVRRVSGVAAVDGELLYIHELDAFLDGAEEDALARALAGEQRR